MAFGPTEHDHGRVPSGCPPVAVPATTSWRRSAAGRVQEWMGPEVARSGWPSWPVRRAMISAQIATAVSSGVRPPRSRPMGARRRARSSGRSMPSSARRLEAAFVGAAAPHHAEVADLGGQGAHDGRDVELGVVGEHADGVERAEAGPDLVEHLLGPVDHHLVGGREAGRGGEHGPGVAHRHVVPQHLGHPAQRGGEVDRSEDHHAGLRGVALHEHRQVGLGWPGPGGRSGGRRDRAAASSPSASRATTRSRSGSPRVPDGGPSGVTSSLAPRWAPSTTVARATGRSSASAARSSSNRVTSPPPRRTGGWCRRR